MQCVELNPVGNFDPWEQKMIDELFHQEISPSLGGRLVFENDNVKLWDIKLIPGERIPFRKHFTNFSCVCTTGGLTLTRSGNGKISMVKINPGDTEYFEFEGKNHIYDLENIGEESILINILEYKKNSIGKQLLFSD
nr:hypothetical protein [uncultured Allomuricauda sp.]